MGLDLSKRILGDINANSFWTSLSMFLETEMGERIHLVIRKFKEIFFFFLDSLRYLWESRSRAARRNSEANIIESFSPARARVLPLIMDSIRLSLLCRRSVDRNESLIPLNYLYVNSQWRCLSR